jgi:hypothetical protein
MLVVEEETKDRLQINLLHSAKQKAHRTKNIIHFEIDKWHVTVPRK